MQAMENKTLEADSFGVIALTDPSDELPREVKQGTNRDQQDMAYFGRAQQLKVG
jgi:hypothetical protein